MRARCDDESGEMRRIVRTAIPVGVAIQRDGVEKKNGTVTATTCPSVPPAAAAE